MKVTGRGVWTMAAALATVAATALAGEPGLVSEKPAAGVQTVKTEKGWMVPYTMTVPGSKVTFEFVPIPGGRFKLGSPEGEKSRSKDEGPQVEVEVGPFWMAKTETTWKQYQLFMNLYTPIKKLVATHPTTKANEGDAITVPTPLYEPDMTYEVGQDLDQPAVTMTPYAAKQYAKYLSKTTGEFYRLPTEAEWEYAARAGTTTAYFWGNDPKQLGEYAWFNDNAGDHYHGVGKKKPNPWGLYDIYGNVAEIVTDQYDKSWYGKFAGKGVVNEADAIDWPTARSKRGVRGGGWADDADRCRSAARFQSDDKGWKTHDPNLPKSPWWYTEMEAKSVGFRLVRPLNAPTAKIEQRFWDGEPSDVHDDIASRLEEGKGTHIPVNPKLAQEIKAIDQ